MIETQEIEPNVYKLSSSDTFPAGGSPSRIGNWVSSLLIKSETNMPTDNIV